MTAPGGPARRLYRALRNPRLAVWLLGALGLWMFLGTVVPQFALDEAAVKAWATANPAIESVVGPLGLHDAYSHPVFLAGMFVLAASTIVCAWERSARALRVGRARGSLTQGALSRLRVARALPLTAEETVEPESALEHADVALRSLGLRVRRGPRVLEADSGSWGLAGSPVFHWALVALFLVVPLGRLTRAEGLMGVTAGTQRVNEPAAYGRLEAGPLHGGFADEIIGVEGDMLLSFMDGGVDRGASPTVTVEIDGVEVARQRVYPNNPLRHGALTIHAEDWGYGVAYSLVDEAGGEIAAQAFIDRLGETTATAPYTSAFTDESGSLVASITMDVASLPGEETSTDPRDRRVEIVATGPDASAVETVAAAGDAIDLGDGLSLRVDRLDYYARLSVVDDWSVSWIYALFLVACAAVSVSVLVPHRVVHVLLDVGDTGESAAAGPSLRVTARHSRSAPGFEDTVAAVLEARPTSTSSVPHSPEEEM